MEYMDQVSDVIEFFIALGSVIGALGLILGFLALFITNSRMRGQVLKIIIISLILVALCGFDTGFNYFHIFR